MIALVRVAISCLLATLAVLNVSAESFHNPYGKLATNATAGDRIFADYFLRETRNLADSCLADVKTLDDWKQERPKLRQQLFEMLGLDPLPAKTDLTATVTGKIEQSDFTVEKLH